MPLSDFLFILKWWAVFFFIGISFFPLTQKVFSKFVDKGYLFSKVLGTLLISYVVYVLGTLRLLQFSSFNILAVWISLVIIQLFFLRREKLDGKTIKIFIVEEFIFFLALLFWSWIRSFQPDIHDLEKFMDFGFINSILRSEYFPPRDMWLTPFPINYYYFGHLFTAVITKLSQIPSLITFNLMIATIFAFTFTLSFSIGINLIQKIKNFSLKKSVLLGLLFGYIVAFSGNLQTIYSLFKSYNGENPVPFWDLALSISTFPNSYWYPNATRFIYHTIHEFPLYSFVVADLHGHVLDIPIVIFLIALSFILLLERRIRLGLIILISFLISIAYMTNAWDGLIYLGLFANILFFLEFIKNKNEKIPKRFAKSVFNAFKYIFLIGVGFIVFTFAFNQNFSPFASGVGVNCAPDFLTKLEKLGPLLFEKGQCQHSPIWQFLILYGFFLYMVTSFLLFIRKKRLITPDYFVAIISLFSILLIITPEIFYLKDIYTGHFRANTMFKLSYQAFMMFSFASVYIAIRIVSSFKSQFKSKLSKIFFVVFIFGGVCLLFLVSIYPYFAVPSGYGDLKIYKGLNGIRYLKELKPSDYAAINWINGNIKNQPVILEAQGDSYTDYARISANTGLPTVLGWTVHEWLWRDSYDVPSSRFDDIKNLYETTDLKEARKIINKYNISLIYIGKMENEKYKVSEDKFSQLGNNIYANTETKIYKIR